MNPENGLFLGEVNTNPYVDKSEMTSCPNAWVRTKRKYVCVTRPREFGKTYAVAMICCAYYGREADSREVFEGLKPASTAPATARGGTVPWAPALASLT